MDIDGLYRISGNLATIQKLRYKVDHGEARPVALPQACRRLKERADHLFFLPRIIEEYRRELYTGTSDPDVVIPEMLSRMNEAGLEKVKAEIQAQLDAFLAK